MSVQTSEGRAPQYHGIRVHAGNSTINIINLYAPARKFRMLGLPDCIQSKPTLILDFYAGHKSTGNSS